MANEEKTHRPLLEDLTYEQALSELEQIVAALEGDGQALDQAMELFERGQSLIRYCTTLLDKAELKVQQISGENLAGFNLQE